MTTPKFTAVLKQLEQRYGSPACAEPADAYELVVYTNCGYPPSQDNCRNGFEALKSGERPQDPSAAGRRGKKRPAAASAS